LSFTKTLSENEAMCIFLGTIFKWGGPASTIIVTDEIQDIWRMFVYVNAWRSDFMNLQFSSFALQMLQWLQEYKQVPMLKYMKNIVAPPEYRRKGVKLYQKKGFHCLEFSKDVYKRLYMHMVSQSKESFVLLPEERNEVEHSHPTATYGKQRPQLKSVIAPKDSTPSTSYEPVPRHSTGNGNSTYSNYKRRGDGREYYQNGYYNENYHQLQRFRGRNYQSQSNRGRENQRGKQKKRTKEVDSYVPENRTSSIFKTPKIIPSISTVEPEEEEQDTPKKAKTDSDADTPNPRFSRAESREDDDVDSVVSFPTTASSNLCSENLQSKLEHLKSGQSVLGVFVNADKSHSQLLWTHKDTSSFVGFSFPEALL